MNDCPICGSPASVEKVYGGYDYDGEIVRYMPHCTNETCPLFHTQSGGEFLVSYVDYTTVADAIAAWNAEPHTYALRGEVYALRAELNAVKEKMADMSTSIGELVNGSD